MSRKLVQVQWHQKGQSQQCTAHLVGKYRFRFDPLHKSLKEYHNYSQQNRGTYAKQDTSFIPGIKMKNNIDTGDHKNASSNSIQFIFFRLINGSIKAVKKPTDEKQTNATDTFESFIEL